MKHRLGFFITGTLAVWLVAALLTWLIWPAHVQSNMICGAVALLLCLIPTLATLMWSLWSFQQEPEQQLTTVLGGTGLRMFIVLGGGLLLSLLVTFFRQHAVAFWLWLLAFYMITLALEIAVLVRERSETLQPKETGETASVSK